MKVIFADFDGVVNSFNNLGVRFVPDPSKVAILNEIQKTTGAMIVVSSTWRLLMDKELIEQRLQAAGLEGGVLDMTPITSPWYRGEEIRTWLWKNEGQGIESYVILDDEPKLYPSQWSNWVQTDSYIGLQKKHAKKAIKILNRKRKPKVKAPAKQKELSSFPAGPASLGGSTSR